MSASIAAAQSTFTPALPGQSAPAPRPQQQQNADLPPGTAILRGHVFAADTGQPLRKAQVRIMTANAFQEPNPGNPPRENRLTTTDAQGAFEFKEVRAGRYSLTASKGSYVSMQYGQTRASEPGKSLEILDAQVVERVDFSLPRGGIITGRVLDEYGEPMSDVMIAPQRFMYQMGQKRLVGGGRTAVSDDEGEFRIFGVPPGQYYLQATYRSVMINTSSDNRSGYAPLYFPGTLDPASAQRVTIGVGTEIRDVVMTMKPVKTGRISGTVLDSKGQPAGGMLMVMSGGPFGMTASGAPIRPDGTFTVGGLAPGEYTLRSMQMGPRPAESEVAFLTVTVGSEDVDNLQLRAVPPSSARGRIVVDAGAALSLPSRLMVSMQPVQFAPMMNGPMQPGTVAEDMTFELKATPGRYRISLGPGAAGWSVRSVHMNGANVTDSGFEIKAFEDVSGLEVELTNKLSTISGVATNARGEVSKDYTAVVFAQDPERWKIGRYQTSSRPDQDGKFKFTGLPEGEYYIVAVDRVETGEAADPEFLEKVRTKASLLTVHEGDTKTVDLRVQTLS